MKNIFLVTALLVTIILKAQAHFGVTEQKLYAFHPASIWYEDYTAAGRRFVFFENSAGQWRYFFDPVTKLTNFCMLVPSSIGQVNALVEGYNKRYVIISQKCWDEYLENGSIIRITLIFDPIEKTNVFTYVQTA